MADALPTLVIAVDGLRAAALGAYGQTAYETPDFDALTAESLTHDACYAPTPEPRDLYERLAGDLPAGSVVLSDDPEATAPLAAAGHTELPLAVASPDGVADSIGETTVAAVFAAAAERLVELLDEREPPPTIWIHLRGLYDPWDAPAELHESLTDEDDPEVVAEPTPPSEWFDDTTSAEACDARFAAACRYAGQVMALDACLAALLDLVDGLLEGREHRLVLAGLRGFPLGEHGRVGGVEPRLFSEQQHVPLIIRGTDPDNRFARDATPVTLDTALASLLTGRPSGESPVLLRSSAASAVIQPDRMLRVASNDEDASPELYVKPDDRWEQNDIASLEEETVAQMLAVIAGGAGVAANAPGP